MKKIIRSIINSLVVKLVLFVGLTSSVSVYFKTQLQHSITLPVWFFMACLLLSSILTCLIVYLVYTHIRKKDLDTIYKPGMVVYHKQGRFPMVVIERHFWKRNTIIVDAFVHGKNAVAVRMNVSTQQIMVFIHTP